MKLIISTPKGSDKTVECDSVHLSVSEDAKGKSGGSYGIRKGHVKALISLAKGKTEAFLNDKAVFVAQTGTGFATVEKDIITVVIEEYTEI